MSATITYKGSTLTTVSNNTTILNTSGTWMEDDIVITDISQSAPVLQIKTDIVPTTESQTITADSGYDGLSSVQINAISPIRTSNDLVVDGATVTIPYGFYSSQMAKSVSSGMAGTPTATKGTVSNHSVSVTPSVTNTTGYITGSTKTGTPVTVSASELVSGSQTITENGTVDVTNLASVTVNVSGSGGGGSASPKQINFIDYDGTIVESYTKSEWQSVTGLPSNPSHSGLTAQGWNWTKAQIDAQLTAMPDGDVWVGQMYITASGDTEIDVRFADSTRLSPYLSCAVNGTITIDWGDNSTSTVTGTQLTSRKDTQHVYASTGDYTITIHVESGSWAFYGTSTYTLLHKNSSTTSVNRVYSNCVQNVRIGADTSIENYAFYNCYSLASVTIPNGVTSIGTNAFGYCYSLASVTIPSGVTSIGINAFNNCHSFTSVTIPGGVTSIGASAFYYCYSLASVTIPNGVTSIGANAFNYCHSLASVTIPSGVTSIGASAFYGCYGMAEYHIKPTTPPTLGTKVFSNIQSDCVIYVPSASLTAYKKATNWSTYASYMRGE